MQNEFLNQEIVAVNDLRLISEKKAQELQAYERKARRCQVQSKWLKLLARLKSEEINHSQARRCQIKSKWRKLLSRLKSEEVNHSQSEGKDKEGHADGSSAVGDQTPVVIPQQLENLIRRQSKSPPWQTIWDSFFGSLGNQELTRSRELKFLLRHGIPSEYRCKIWKGLIHLRVKSQRERMGEGYYQRLLDQKPLSKSPNTYDPIVKQIELDLLRTLPNNRDFKTLKSDGTCRLRRVLTAYSRHNPKVGYCQGLNRLAAVALLHMPEEEDAFWTLVCIVEHLMPPDYYTQNLLGVHVDQYVFKDLLKEKLPRVHEVLEKLGIEISLFSWFLTKALTCFVDNIPDEIHLRVWDTFLYEGNKVLFRFALAFFKLNEERILAAHDSVSVNTFLRTLGETGSTGYDWDWIDVHSLCHITFSFLNPFPISRIRQKRIHYTAVVKSELERSDQIRKTMPIQIQEAKVMRRTSFVDFFAGIQKLLIVVSD